MARARSTKRRTARHRAPWPPCRERVGSAARARLLRARDVRTRFVSDYERLVARHFAAGVGFRHLLKALFSGPSLRSRHPPKRGAGESDEYPVIVQRILQQLAASSGSRWVFARYTIAIATPFIVGTTQALLGGYAERTPQVMLLAGVFIVAWLCGPRP